MLFCDFTKTESPLARPFLAPGAGHVAATESITKAARGCQGAACVSSPTNHEEEGEDGEEICPSSVSYSHATFSFTSYLMLAETAPNQRVPWMVTLCLQRWAWLDVVTAGNHSLILGAKLLVSPRYQQTAMRNKNGQLQTPPAALSVSAAVKVEEH